MMHTLRCPSELLKAVLRMSKTCNDETVHSKSALTTPWRAGQAADVTLAKRWSFLCNVDDGWQVAVKVVECAPELIISEFAICDEAVPLANMVLAHASCGDRAAVEAAVEFFMMVNTVSVEERREAFRSSLFGQLLQVLLAKVSMPGVLLVL